MIPTGYLKVRSPSPPPRVARSLELAGQENESSMWHLKNIVSSFEALMDVFEKQTRSPGIKSCYDLQARAMIITNIIPTIIVLRRYRCTAFVRSTKSMV
jgi:hypothetical protein